MYWKKYTEDIERDIYGSQKKVWRMLRKRKSEVNENIQTNAIGKNQWEAYFEHLHKKEEHNSEHLAWINGNEDNIEITIDDIHKAMKWPKHRKAPGSDGMRNELLKYGEKHIEEEPTKLLNIILKCGLVPAERKTRVTIPREARRPTLKTIEELRY